MKDRVVFRSVVFIQVRQFRLAAAVQDEASSAWERLEGDQLGEDFRTRDKSTLPLFRPPSTFVKSLHLLEPAVG